MWCGPMPISSSCRSEVTRQEASPALFDLGASAGADVPSSKDRMVGEATTAAIRN